VGLGLEKYGGTGAAWSRSGVVSGVTDGCGGVSSERIVIVLVSL